MSGSTGSVVVIGSTNIDLVMQVAHLPTPGETVGDGAFVQAMGGKGANQALAAARGGAPVTFISAVGDDDYGRMARENLVSEGLDCQFMVPSAEPTGTALIFVDADGENCIGVAPGANAMCNATLLAPAQAVIERAAVVLMQLEIPVATVRKALSLPAGRHMLNAAPVGALDRLELTGVDTLVVNQIELAHLLARMDDPVSGPSGSNATSGLRTGQPAGDEALRRACSVVHALGVRECVVTLGPHGVYLSEEGVGLRQPGFEVEAIDTTGAGDTFCGALAAQLAAGQTLPAATRVAQAAAALACTELGAQTAIPTASAVRAFLARSG
ncbi:MAG: ribokinase [Pseudomonadota bacterium]